LRSPLTRSALLALLGLGGLAGAAWAEPQASVAVEDGNVVLVAPGGTRTTLTDTGRDSEAVLSPDGHWVVYTRAGASQERSDDDEFPDCATLPAPDELRRIRIDGSDDTLLMTGGAGSEPKESLCGFFEKQFSADGETLYFLSPAWTTSAALHAFSLQRKAARYLIPANAYLVLHDCKDKDLAGAIMAEQHRYFVLGGSYDWFWLFDPAGTKEIGPVGEFDTVEDLKSFITDSGRCTEP
jgi:hypothetical protein